MALLLAFADPAIQPSGGPLHLSGGPFSVTATISDSGGNQGHYSLTGYTALAGTSTVEGHLFATPGATSGTSPAPATGTVPAGGSTSATLYSGASTAYGDQVAGYSAGAGLDVVLVLTDTDTGAATTYTLPGAVFLGTSPAQLAITGVRLAAG